MHNQFIAILREMVSLLGNAYDGFGDDDALRYDCKSELVAKINEKALIETYSAI